MIKVNEYFEGKVKSLGGFEVGALPASCGVMLAGSYEFKTQSQERMQILQGSMRVKLPAGDWQEFAAGTQFSVPADSAFLVEVGAPCIYLCQYQA